MKKQYDTRIKLQYLLGTLDTEIKDQINKSTARNWNLDDILSRYLLLDENGIKLDYKILSTVIDNKKLLDLSKFLWHTYKLLFDTLSKEEYNKILSNSNFKKRFVQIIEQQDNTISLKKRCSHIGITTNKFKAWKRQKRCQNSLKELCRLKHPHQLLDSEVKTINKHLTINLSTLKKKSAVYAKMIRESITYLSLSTFYDYAKLLGFRNYIRPKRSKKVGIRAFRPFEYLHMDVSRIRFHDHTKAFLYVIKDNYSKAILGYKLDNTCNSTTSKENLALVFQKYNLSTISDIQLLTDDGSENKGKVTEFLSSKNNIFL